jgi:hypothetical protein
MIMVRVVEGQSDDSLASESRDGKVSACEQDMGSGRN